MCQSRHKTFFLIRQLHLLPLLQGLVGGQPALVLPFPFLCLAGAWLCGAGGVAAQPDIASLASSCKLAGRLFGLACPSCKGFPSGKGSSFTWLFFFLLTLPFFQRLSPTLLLSHSLFPFVARAQPLLWLAFLLCSLVAGVQPLLWLPFLSLFPCCKGSWRPFCKGSATLSLDLFPPCCKVSAEEAASSVLFSPLARTLGLVAHATYCDSI